MARSFPQQLVRAARILLPILVGLVGAWIGMAVAASTTVAMGPFRVQLDAGFGPGVTDINLPPLGRITADTHLAPLRLDATLRDLDVEQLAEVLRDRSVENLAIEVERDALDRLWPYSIRVVAVAMLGAFVLSVLAFRRSWRRIRVALLTALIAVGGGGALAVGTFRPEAFLSPTFSGSLSLAPRLFGPVEAATEQIGYFRAQLERIVDGALRAFAAVQGNPLGRPDEIRVLHISDIHLSALGFEFARQVAEGFDVDFVIDSGDVTSFGTPAESLILQAIPSLGRRYVFVRGNHDSLLIQVELEKVSEAVVLDGTATTIEGLTVYGLGHPVFTFERGEPLEDEEFEERARAAGGRILADLDTLERPADIVVVHDRRMAETVAGRVPVVISGHFHENSASVINGTVFLQVGTTGGAGPTAFTEEGDVPLSAEILYFLPGIPPELVAWDVVSQLPATGNLTVERHLVADEFGDLVLSPSPTAEVSPAPSAPASP